MGRVSEVPVPPAKPSSESSPRVAIVLSHPTQYYSPWFRWMREHTGLNFRVFYLWNFGVTEQRDVKFQKAFRWDIDLLSGYDHEFVPNVAKDPGTHHFSGLNNPELPQRLAAWKPDALLLFGYKWRTHLSTIFWARRSGVPLIFRGDSHFLGRGLPSFKTRFALRTLYAQFAAFLPVGAANRDYFTTLGVPASKLFLAPHAVNDAHFAYARPEYHAAAAALRSELGLRPEQRVVLFAGKFVPEKQPCELLEAFLALNPTNAALVFVGDGPEKEAMHATATAAGAASVHFLPFANQSEIPACYLLADVFALPSRGLYETWGLAVNEAMHLGVPALVSDRVGCARDLITEGETGWVFPAEDRAALKAKLREALEAVSVAPRRERMREQVMARVAGYNYESAAAGLAQALAHVVKRSKDRPEPR